MTTFAVGSLVRCRKREWVVLPSESPEVLLLRPLGGAELEQIGIYLPAATLLPTDAIEPATFPVPDLAQASDHIAGRLLRDATRLTFRSGAGPFRCLGRIAVRPRPFQLVPLLMALRLDPVRLLIADDVGVGKTIEAGLIARELLDRGDARRLAVICPPHLCEQWKRELAEKFAIEAVIVRSGTITQLERALPPGDISVFEHYPAQVVSIDFVKFDPRRASFVRGCPDLVIVDEAHSDARAGESNTAQQRHALLRDLALNGATARNRHLLLLTATPHSGFHDSFLSLLELLNPDFARLDLDALSDRDRRQMAAHYVQRRRVDVQHWLGQDTPFPQRDSHDVTYLLKDSPDYQKLFADVYAFARELVRDQSAAQATWKQRVRYWTALALLRCVLSSPAAADVTLRQRILRLGEATVEAEAEEDQGHLARYVLDMSESEVPQDFDPNPVVEEGERSMGQTERGRLQAFAHRATRLYGAGDPKLAVAAREIETLLRGGFRPIIYCRFIATANYVAEQLKLLLKTHWPDLHIIAVTGTASEEEREERVADLGKSPRRVLVATDCLSEGINLQDLFDAVLHYDLPWNPNRLEQREGRVDRYGQRKPVVKTVLLYGRDNPIDEAVFTVLIRKARSIHKSLGVMIPLPMDSESVVEAVVRSLFAQKEEQLSLFDPQMLAGTEAAEVAASWDRAEQGEKESRTRFAQHAIKPGEVAQELSETDAVLGDSDTVQTFVRNACERLGAPLGPVHDAWRLHLAALPDPIRERVLPVFQSRPGAKAPTEVRIAFASPAPEDTFLVHRLHPLTESLAEYLLDGALSPQEERPPASRCGATRTTGVARRTVLFLLRLRLLIESPGKAAPLLAEELIVAGFEGRPGSLTWLAESVALRLLQEIEPTGNLTTAERQNQLGQVLTWLPDLEADFAAVGRQRAEKLLEAHRRVRQATRGGRVTVRPQLPLDVLGVYVLVPVPKGMVS